MKGFFYLINLSLYLLIACADIVELMQEAVISKYDHAAMRNLLLEKSLPFEDCGSKHIITHLNISCCSTIPCEMRRGSTVKVNIIFNDNENSTIYLKHKVRWIFNAIKTRAYITPDPCDGVQKCLSNAHEGKTYLVSVFVNNTLPVIPGTVLWEAVNEYSENILCFKLPVVITM